ncbi:MAG: heavy-metal-associated domain-containing protein [Thermomicrobiales bacterium]
MEVQTFRVPDVSCDHCVRAITVELTKLPGIDQVEVDLDAKTVTVAHDGTVSALEMREGIAEAGYEVTA